MSSSGPGSVGFSHPTLSTEDSIRSAYAADASGLSSEPLGVARPRSEGDVVELLRSASGHGVSVTAQGLRSSTTGSSVAAEGIALSLEQMNEVLEIDPERGIARVEPGVVLGPFRQELETMGLYYPPDPTSEFECTIGGTIATNASGARTYHFGPTRRYVRGLRVVLADGSVLEIARNRANKNATGYFGLQDPVDLFLGSEGTLGVVTEIELALLEPPRDVVTAVAFFEDWRMAIRCVQALDREGQAGHRTPLSMELIDSGALDLIRQWDTKLMLPETARAALYFEETVSATAGNEELLAFLEPFTPLGEDTQLALDTASRRALRDLRHALPAAMNEAGARVPESGGRKLSTDFAVPLDALETLMADVYQIASERFQGPVLAYGHVGNGHPHFNLVAEDALALERAEDAIFEMTRRALALGGNLSAEHGIGKLKAPFFRELYPRWMVESMMAVKQALDPKLILGPGNLFGPLF